MAPASASASACIAPDARGHGDTDWATDYSFEAHRNDVLAVMEALGVIAAVVVAHSMAGMAAYLLAATRPDAVRALVLEDPPPPEAADPPRPIPGGPEPGDAMDWRAVAQLHAWRNDPGPQWWDYADQIRCRTLVLGGQRSHCRRRRWSGSATRSRAAASGRCRPGTACTVNVRGSSWPSCCPS